MRMVCCRTSALTKELILAWVCPQVQTPDSVLGSHNDFSAYEPLGVHRTGVSMVARSVADLSDVVAVELVDGLNDDGGGISVPL